MLYQNFDLEIINPKGSDRLCARVLESPQGDCPFIDVKWPFDAEQESVLLSEIYGGLRQRHGRSSKTNTIQDFGGKLFEAVFAGDIEHLFRSSLDSSFRSGKGLRVCLRLPEDSELHVRPWEFLFDTESREFLAVREHTPLVRYLPVAQPIPPITVEGPLRILVALSSPTDHPRLDIAREWEILRNALEPSISAGQLELRRVPGRCTFDNLRDSLRHFGAHIFHFVGHGIPGALVLEQESGKGLEMEATHLRSAFPSGALPRLVVLNACSGAITGTCLSPAWHKASCARACRPWWRCKPRSRMTPR
jgi:CHAT domain